MLQHLTDQVKLMSKWLLVDSSWQKNYVDRRHESFALRLATIHLFVYHPKSVFHFDMKGMWSSQYFRPIMALERICETTHWIILLSQHSHIDHNVLHMLMHPKYMPNPSHVIQHQDIALWENVTYEYQ